MKLTRRNFSKLAGTGVLAAAAPGLFAPALAQDKPLRIGIIAPRSGAAGHRGRVRNSRGAMGRRADEQRTAASPGAESSWCSKKETNPKNTIEAFGV